MCEVISSARAAGSAVRRAEIKEKAASFEGDTVVPLSAALLDGGSAASSRQVQRMTVLSPECIDRKYNIDKILSDYKVKE